MAEELHSLIRLHQWGVDEKRRKLAELLRHLADLENQGVRLEEELVQEQQTASASPGEAGYLYGNYAEAVIARRERIAGEVAETEERIAAAREELNEAFRELKKYEIAQENRDKIEARELSLKEQADLDELGIKGFIRKRQRA